MIINNSNISRLFISIKENEVIYVATNLKNFIGYMKKIEPNIKSRSYYSKHFLENDFYYYQNPITREQFTFQKIENEKD